MLHHLNQDKIPDTFSIFFGGLWLEPYNTETLYTSGYQALSLSEQLDIPVVIRLTNPLLSSEDNYTYPRKKKETLKFNYPIERQKFIVHPTNWQYQRQQLSLRLEKVQKYIEARYDSVLSNCSGEVENVVIVLGASSKNDIQLYRNWEQLQLSTYPLPYTTILKFIKNKKKIMIIEQGDDYAFQKIQLATGSRSNITSKTGFVPNLSGTYRNWSGLEKLFKGLKATNPSFVVSDLTQFTQETTNTINSCLCLGSSISVTIGLTEAAIPYPFCIIGDISFQHTGTDNVLYEARERGSRFGLIVIDNGGSWCTGGQKATYPLKDELHDWNLLTVDYENTSINQFSQIFNKFKSDNQLNILWVNYNNL